MRPLPTLIMACLAAASAATANQPATAPDPASHPANVWVHANPPQHLPGHIPDASWSRSDGYCGSVFRGKTSTILFRSGVSSKQMNLNPGFYSNAWLEWDLAANEVRTLDVSTWSGGSYGGGALPGDFKDRPTPTPRHTYDGAAYVENMDAVYVMLGANWRIGTNATDEAKAAMAVDNASTWRYSLADGKWRRIDDSIRKFWPREVSPYESHMRHWPQGNRLIFLNDGGTRYAEFDLQKETWEKVELENKCPMSLYNARSTWDSKRGLWVFRLGPKLCTFNPKDKTFAAIADAFPMQEAKDDPRRAGKGVAYIPRHDVYLITGPTGDDTWVYSPTTNAWTNVRGGDVKLINGYAEYDPKTDLVGLVYQQHTFTFRYVPMPPDAAGAHRPQ